MVAVMLAMLLAAIEATIVATAMPNIADQLGGFSLYGWVFSSYLLMQAVTTPIFGKLADIFGRKPVFVGGVGIFMLGSACCALSPSMPLLVAFRFLQGIGAGAVVPIGVTLAGDLYTLAERPLGRWSARGARRLALDLLAEPTRRRCGRGDNVALFARRGRAPFSQVGPGRGRSLVGQLVGLDARLLSFQSGVAGAGRGLRGSSGDLGGRIVRLGSPPGGGP